jgi:hypothetical protein
MTQTDQATGGHDDLWAGIGLKIENASFHLEGMGKALQPPERTSYTAIFESHGMIVGGNWHRAFYAHLDAFLSAARSVPELIRCCFGEDDGNREMKTWFKGLDQVERDRRKKFTAAFDADYRAFRALPLGTARHISEHRTGVPPVTATVSGRFGITYRGDPIKQIPTSETRKLPAEYAWMEKSIPVRPMWTDFDIDGKPLFETCRDYLNSAQGLIDRARALAQEVHGDSELTSPSEI